MRPKWLKQPQTPVDALAAIATGGVAPASNVEVMRPSTEQPKIEVDLLMQKLSQLPTEKQAKVKKMLATWITLKRYGLSALSLDELVKVYERLPDHS